MFSEESESITIGTIEVLPRIDSVKDICRLLQEIGFSETLIN